MNYSIQFEKVSFPQFLKDCQHLRNGIEISIGISMDDDYYSKYMKQIYNNITLPKRGAKRSAGYDFAIPFNIELFPKEQMLIPTGIRCRMPDAQNVVLMIYPRSGLGSKNRFVPCNLTGIIDADYYDAKNEGHILMKMTNDGDKTLELVAGSAFCQGVFIPYYTTDDDDNVQTARTGGFGSTDKDGGNNV